MSLTADPIVRRKLHIVKGLYRRALVQSTKGHVPLDRLLAVIMFDLANETLLKMVLVAADPRTGKVPSDIPDLIQKCDPALARHDVEPLPEVHHIRAIRGVRNDAQHDGRTPTETELSDARTYTRDFLDRATAQVWGLSLASLRLADTITDEFSKSFLVKAEEALDNDDYQSAAQQANAALEVSLRTVMEPLVGGPAQGSWFGDANDRIFLGRQESLRTFRRMQETVQLLALGVDLAQRQRCREYAGEVWLTLNDDSMHFDGTKEDLTREEAEWVVSYCFDTISEIEARAGDMERPFGRAL